MALTKNQLLKMQATLSTIELSLLSNIEKIEDIVEKLSEESDRYEDKIDNLSYNFELTDLQEERLSKYEEINDEIQVFIDSLQDISEKIEDAKGDCSWASSSIKTLLTILS